MCTIKDVAKEAGVAISTVSNVLNGMPNISEEITQKVLIASKKLNYKPNLNAKLLRSGTNRIIAVFLATIQGEFYSSFIQSIQRKCEEKGYILQIFILNHYDNKETLRIMTGFGLTGVLVLNEFIKDDIIKRLPFANIPVVVCDRELCLEGISSVTLDNYHVSCELMEYLVETGHTKIGYLHGTYENPDNVKRFQAYQDIMKKYDLPYDESIILEGRYHCEETYAVMEAFLQRGTPLPQAFFCANDNMAVGCMDALHKAGVHVPDDISIIGFDDDDSSQYHQPKLTTVAVASEALGTTATEELIRLMESQDVLQGISQVIPARFVQRDSVKRRI
ncbi:MAG: LacI family DNA-binding transcriptional regulator [Eubacteriales bacterium]